MYSAYQLENYHIIDIKWFMSIQNIHTNDHKEKKTAKHPYHMYPKEIVATHFLILAKIWYNSVSDKSNNTQLSPTFENIERYKI